MGNIKELPHPLPKEPESDDDFIDDDEDFEGDMDSEEDEIDPEEDESSSDDNPCHHCNPKYQNVQNAYLDDEGPC